MMSFTDFRDIFTNFYACIDFPDHWSGVRFEGIWTEKNSIGLPHKDKLDRAQNFGSNPQIIVETTKEVNLFIIISQEDGRFSPGHT